MPDQTDQPTQPAPCLHTNFNAAVNVIRLYSGEVRPYNQEAAVIEVGEDDGPDAFTAEITVKCADCEEPFTWIGTGIGLMPDRPMTSVDRTQLRAPIKPAGQDPDHPLGMPGFTMREIG